MYNTDNIMNNEFEYYCVRIINDLFPKKKKWYDQIACKDSQYKLQAERTHTTLINCRMYNVGYFEINFLLFNVHEYSEHDIILNSKSLVSWVTRTQ